MEKREKEYTNLDQERIVTVSDLLKEILRRIGLVIILGIIVAALCCGYKYAKTAKLRKLQTVKIRLRRSNLPTKSRRM